MIEDNTYDKTFESVTNEKLKEVFGLGTPFNIKIISIDGVIGNGLVGQIVSDTGEVYGKYLPTWLEDIAKEGDSYNIVLAMNKTQIRMLPYNVEATFKKKSKELVAKTEKLEEKLKDAETKNLHLTLDIHTLEDRIDKMKNSDSLNVDTLINVYNKLSKDSNANDVIATMICLMESKKESKDGN